MVLNDESIEEYIKFDQTDHHDPEEDGLTLFQQNLVM